MPAEDGNKLRDFSAEQGRDSLKNRIKRLNRVGEIGEMKIYLYYVSRVWRKNLEFQLNYDEIGDFYTQFIDEFQG